MTAPRRTTVPKRTGKLLFLLAALALTAGLLCAPASAFDTARDSRLLLLVNKTHTVPRDYVPELRKLSGSVPVAASSVSLRPEAAQAYIDMYKAMRADGVKVCTAQSGYRSYSTQQYLVNTRTRDRVRQGMSQQKAYSITTMYTAPAGASEHQLGLAMDCAANGKLNASFAATPAGKWLAEHAWEYGFILRYDGEKTDLTMIGAEAWHYRYVGVPHAKFITDHQFCLEEYITYLHEHGSASVEVGDTTYDIYWTDDSGLDLTGLEVTDLSGDNAGGWVVTAVGGRDPLFSLRGHWSEAAFRALQDQGVSFDSAPDPSAAITGRELARICGLSGGSSASITREDAAAFLAPQLPRQWPVRLIFTDLGQIDGDTAASVQSCVASGLFTQGVGQAFRPKDLLTWAEAATLAVRLRAL